MMSDKILSYLASAVVCLLLLVAGCAPTAALPPRFTEQDLTTYKVTTEAERSLKFEGSLLNDTDSKGGRNHKRIEIIFTQQIQSVDDGGNAVAKITIEELKCISVYQNNPVLDFDSSREKDRNNPLAKLIGQSYTVEIAPAGQVTKVVDVEQARAAVKGGSSAHKVALMLLSTEAIKERHGTLTLPDADKKKLRIGDNWNSIKVFNFGLMGTKSYEKIYTAKKIKRQNDRRVALIEMSAIPSSEMAEQLHKERAVSDFSGRFANTETFTGRLKWDLTTGKIEEYLEKLQSEWVVVDPDAEQKGDKEPDAIKMSAIRFYSIEKID